MLPEHRVCIAVRLRCMHLKCISFLVCLVAHGLTRRTSLYGFLSVLLVAPVLCEFF